MLRKEGRESRADSCLRLLADAATLRNIIKACTAQPAVHHQNGRGFGGQQNRGKFIREGFSPSPARGNHVTHASLTVCLSNPSHPHQPKASASLHQCDQNVIK